MRQRYNEAPKKPNFIFQVTDLQQEKIIIEKSGENRKGDTKRDLDEMRRDEFAGSKRRRSKVQLGLRIQGFT